MLKYAAPSNKWALRGWSASKQKLGNVLLCIWTGLEPHNRKHVCQTSTVEFLDSYLHIKRSSLNKCSCRNSSDLQAWVYWLTDSPVACSSDWTRSWASSVQCADLSPKLSIQAWRDDDSETKWKLRRYAGCPGTSSINLTARALPLKSSRASFQKTIPTMGTGVDGHAYKGPILRAKFCRAVPCRAAPRRAEPWLVHSVHSESHADGPNVAPSDRNFIHLTP
jgi:hypothetical protein